MSNQLTTNEDLDAEETPLGRVINSRRDVSEVDVHYGDGRAIIFVTFLGSEIPPGFASDYDMTLVSARLWDNRPLWKRLLGIGPPCRLVGHFIREREPISWGDPDE